MGKMIENPRYNVVSLRISDEELDKISKLAKLNRSTISEFVRLKLFGKGE